MIVIMVTDWLGGSWIWKSPAGKAPWQWAEQEQKIQAEGVVYRVEKNTRISVYLKKAYLIHSESSKKYPIRNIKCKGKEDQLDGLKEGMTVVLEGRLSLPEIPSNPGEFNKREYESSKKIDFYLENPYIKKISGKPSELQKTVDSWKKVLNQRCEEVYPAAEAGILEAMLFGEKDNLDSEIKASYQAAGISHVLAISGLHISLLGMGIAGILRKMGLPMPAWAFLSVGVLAGYGFFIGQPVTALRAILMFTVLQGGRILGRSYDLLSALAFTGIFMLLDNPDLIYDGGCRLSFGAVIGMGWYVNEKKVIFAEYFSEKRMKGKKIIETFITGGFLWIFTLPVVLDIFYQVSVVGILWNLLVIPLLPFAIISGGIGVLLAGEDVLLGSMAGSAAFAIFRLYEWIGNVSQKMLWGMWTPGQPSKVNMIGVYLILGGVLLMEKQMQKKSGTWKKSGIYVAVIETAAVLGVILLMAHPWKQQEKITFLDVGQGDAVICQTGGETILIDGGSSSRNKAGTYIILPYLKQQGISRLTAVILTHTDQDHTNGAKEVLEEGKMGWLSVENFLYPQWMEETKKGQELIETAKEAGVCCESIGTGDLLQAGKGCAEILYPGKHEDVKEPNAGSLLFVWEWAGLKTLFTGDLPQEQEKEILFRIPQCEILKVGHHGSATSTCRSFLEKVQPSVAVVSCSKTNRYGHPAPETVERLEKSRCQIFYTMQGGAVTVEQKRGKVKMRYHTQNHRRFRLMKK